LHFINFIIMSGNSSKRGSRRVTVGSSAQAVAASPSPSSVDAGFSPAQLSTLQSLISSTLSAAVQAPAASAVQPSISSGSSSTNPVTLAPTAVTVRPNESCQHVRRRWSNCFDNYCWVQTEAVQFVLVAGGMVSVLLYRFRKPTCQGC